MENVRLSAAVDKARLTDADKLSLTVGKAKLSTTEGRDKLSLEVVVVVVRLSVTEERDTLVSVGGRVSAVVCKLSTAALSVVVVVGVSANEMAGSLTSAEAGGSVAT
mgnify:CR=1 FL=1